MTLLSLHDFDFLMERDPLSPEAKQRNYERKYRDKKRLQAGLPTIPGARIVRPMPPFEAGE